MSSKSPAFQFYPTDFLAGSVATYSLEERGAYITLLAYDWSLNGLPNEPKILGKLLGISSRAFTKLWAVLGEQFVVGDDGRLRNPRLQAEREKQLAYSEAMSGNGKKGGRPRKPQESRGLAAEKPSESSLSPSSITTTTTTPVAVAPGAARPSRKRGDPAPWMARFAPLWREAYGGEIPKGAATALRPVVSSIGEEEAVARFERYCAKVQADYASVHRFAQTHGGYADDAPADIPDWIREQHEAVYVFADQEAAA